MSWVHVDVWAWAWNGWRGGRARTQLAPLTVHQLSQPVVAGSTSLHSAQPEQTSDPQLHLFFHDPEWSSHQYWQLATEASEHSAHAEQTPVFHVHLVGQSESPSAHHELHSVMDIMMFACDKVGWVWAVRSRRASGGSGVGWARRDI